MSRHRTLVFAFAVLLAPGLLVAAKDEQGRKQKQAVQANLKKLNNPNLALTETDLFLIASTLPEAKSKALGEQLDKQYKAVLKALKVEESDKPWPGKLAVYVFAARDDYTSFVRQVEQRRPDADESSTVVSRGDEPHIALTPEPGTKPTEAELATAAGFQVAAAVLGRRAGPAATLPEWLRDGFGRVMHFKADPKRYADYKTRAKSLVVGTAARPSFVKVTDVWGGTKNKDSAIVAASLVDFMAFGPEASKFPRFLKGFQPSDERPEPNVQTALDAAEWKTDVLERAWKTWVLKGK
jgi:hypothetical protein